MNEEQRDKLSQALLEESLACANRNDIQDSVDSLNAKKLKINAVLISSSKS